jgi:hypothetical protein
MKPWKLRSLGNFHQQPFGLGILDAVHKAAALVHVTHSLGQSDAGLNEHHDAHAVMLDILIHGAILQMRSCEQISVPDGLHAFREAAPQPDPPGSSAPAPVNKQSLQHLQVVAG